MAQLSAYVKGIVVLVLTAGFGQLLLPQGEMQKYVRFVVGLLLTAAFTLWLTGVQWDVESLVPDLPTTAQYTDDATQQQIKKVYQQQLQQHIREKFAVDFVHVTIDEQMRIVDVQTNDPQTTQAIKDYLAVP